MREVVARRARNRKRSLDDNGLIYMIDFNIIRMDLSRHEVCL